MASTYELIASQTLGSDTASVTFSSIPATYDDLVVVASTRTSASVIAENPQLTFNGDTGSNYSYRRLRGTGAAASSSAYSSQASINTVLPGATATSSTFGSWELYIPNYSGSAYKSVSWTSITENNATTAYIEAVAGLWSSTSAITSITFDVVTGDYVTNSSFQLYGVTHA